jgi:hypothetical protein
MQKPIVGVVAGSLVAALVVSETKPAVLAEHANLHGAHEDHAPVQVMVGTYVGMTTSSSAAVPLSAVSGPGGLRFFRQ